MAPCFGSCDDAGDPRSTCTTDATGLCSFELTVGEYTVLETDPPGYTSTTSNSFTVEVREGEVSEVLFGGVTTHCVFLPVIMRGKEPPGG
ncbi:MAG: hypothetical protein KJ935_06685 [Candidatus Omnitrophica bacterium]|nr:hypothetical protein [Candidatus Omnitrophota bacterium]MCG2770095.1 hypothetical protein [Anaerolineae bacterium]